MKIGITGANGFVGGNLIRKLIREEHTLRVLQFHDHQALDGIELDVVTGDLRKPDTLERFCEGLEVVFHLAAKISIGGNSLKEMNEINVVGTQNLVNAAKKAGVKRFIHFSSIHALENKFPEQLLNEKSPLAIHSKSFYEFTKSVAEKWVLEQQSENFDVIVLNPTAIIGPNDFKPSLIGQLFIQVAQGKIHALIPGGYNWVDVRDVCDAAIQAIEKGRGGERYILSGTWKSVVDFIKMINQEMGKEKNLPVFPFWIAEIGVPFISIYSKITGGKPLYTAESIRILKTSPKKVQHTKASKELGFGPRSLRETVRDTIDWLQENNYINQ